LLLGDSITQEGADPSIDGFQTLLEADYIRRADIFNRGLYGYNMRWFLMHLPKLIGEFKNQCAPSLITLFLGANDADIPTGTEYVPLENYEQFTKEIVLKLRKAFPNCSFILLTPPPVGDSEPYNRTNATAGKYATACKNAGNALGVPVIDLWTDMQPKRESYLSDDIHLNDQGNRFVYQALSSNPAIGGFQTLLEADYVRRADIINRGLSGYNTRWYLNYLPQIINEFQHQQAPVLITLFLGANDADTTETQQVPLANYEENTKEIVRQLQSAFPFSSIILITPPCVGDNLVFSRNNTATGKYATACKNAGKALGIPVIDLWTSMQPQRESYLSDAISPKGHDTNGMFQKLLLSLGKFQGRESSTIYSYVSIPICQLTSMLAGSIIATLSLLQWTNAYPDFCEKIPNGDSVPRVLAVGHVDPFGGGKYTQFGLDFMKANYRWSKTLCEMDSDGDGATNGEELGDPCCHWSPMAMTPLRENPTSPGHVNEFTDEQLAQLKCSQNDEL
ncbi:isoamyl acetate-hydrolyzing esterase, partial [Thraustotheca clavata]